MTMRASPVPKTVGAAIRWNISDGRNRRMEWRNDLYARKRIAPAFAPARNFQHGADTTTVRANDGQFQIVTLGLASNLQPFQVERVIGNSPLVQFLSPFPGGRYQVQEASYDPKSNQWFYVYGDDIRNPGEFGHWTGRGMNWNSMCAECHDTRRQKELRCRYGQLSHDDGGHERRL